MKLLLAEDSATCQKHVAELVGQDFKLTVATSLAESMEIVTAGAVQAALVDLTLTDASGTDVVEKLRALAPKMPIVVLTGEGDARETAVLKAGADEFLLKENLTRDAIVRALCRAAERRDATDLFKCPLLEQCQLEKKQVPVPAPDSDKVPCPMYDAAVKSCDAAEIKLDKMEAAFKSEPSTKDVPETVTAAALALAAAVVAVTKGPGEPNQAKG